MHILNRYSIAGLLILSAASCSKDNKDSQIDSEKKTENKTTTEQLTGGTLFFKAGFQGNTSIGPLTSQRDDILGSENAYDWTSTLQGSSALFKEFYLNYESGTAADRKASIITMPNTDPAANEKVLEFKIDKATKCYEADAAYPDGLCKARISGELFARTGLNEYYQKARVYFPDLQILESSISPRLYRWFCLWECGNDNTLQSVDKAFKAGLYLKKATPGTSGPLRFYARGENSKNGGASWTNEWEVENSTFKVPANKWMTVELYIKEGDANTGRFYVAVTPDGEPTAVIFNKKGYTYNKANTSPNGIEELNAFKLYCSADVVEAFTSQGKSLRVLFDDLEMWKERRPE